MMLIWAPQLWCCRCCPYPTSWWWWCCCCCCSGRNRRDLHRWVHLIACRGEKKPFKTIHYCDFLTVAAVEPSWRILLLLSLILVPLCLLHCMTWNHRHHIATLQIEEVFTRSEVCDSVTWGPRRRQTSRFSSYLLPSFLGSSALLYLPDNSDVLMR